MSTPSPSLSRSSASSSSSLADRWLNQRAYPDLPAEVERLLREAGLAWHDQRSAEGLLAEAESRCPDHVAVMIAQYRFRLYKHRFTDALTYAGKLLAWAARGAGLPADYWRVTRADATFASADPALRFWMWALQAYGYVLLRCEGIADTARAERENDGLQALRHLAWLDEADQTKTRTLLQVIDGREQVDPTE